MSLFKKDTPAPRASKRDPLTPLDDMPDATEPARFLGPETFEDIPGYVFLNWDTSVGVLRRTLSFK
ncbi:hypothetical protein [Kibdelosporangium aridum]|uniref:hypothetical protein n=1 Tax=Kibdelosporangium aridum TaxID=2030 RepID=UPI000525C397